MANNDTNASTGAGTEESGGFLRSLWESGKRKIETQFSNDESLQQSNNNNDSNSTTQNSNNDDIGTYEAVEGKHIIRERWILGIIYIIYLML